MFTKVKDRIFAALLFLCLIPILLVSLINYKAAETALLGQYTANIREHLLHLDHQLSLYLKDSGVPENQDGGWLLARRLHQANGHSPGVLVSEWGADQVERWLQLGNQASPTTLFIFSPDNMLLSPDKASAQNTANLLTFVHNNQGKEVALYSDGKESMYLFHYRSPETGMTYVELLPESKINRDLSPLKRNLLVVTILVILFAAIVARKIAQWFDAPIRSLIEATEALQQGNFSIRVKKHRMAEIAQLEEKFNRMASQLQALIKRERDYMQTGLDQIVRSFYLAVEMKDPYTAGHSERVTEYALMIYDHMNTSEKVGFTRDDLRYAGLMHDIGKVAIPDRVLLKEGKLTNEEYELIKLHASIGANIVNQIISLSHVSPGVRHHHERWDGRGYPDRLSGTDIPLMGRILAVADTFDAMTSTRSYRNAMTLEAAHAEILRCSGTQFDPEIVRVFCEAFRSGACHLLLQQMDQRKGEVPMAAQS
ncbi:HD domain-containing protein [Brevibacillus ruminantium]|uniref:HD domain-containing protein n=1 Tax=Brevibacillus ruminantium TaxID=2950604 RepID=A0ABY4WFQ7_9BACL|nr:HD domain-containing phosphohydrolase [Brevibacillus ruminantium]USG65868.1 HD domain-containing protein [Brevibacillus ruminantium]